MNEAAITAKIGRKEMLKLKARYNLALQSGKIRLVTQIQTEIARVSK